MSRFRKRRHRDIEQLKERVDALHLLRVEGQSKKRSGVTATIIGLLLIAFVMGAIYLIYTTAIGAGTAGEPVQITVEEGDSLSVVADKLSSSGAIESATGFKLEARLKGGGTLIKPGDYTFEPGTENAEILAQLTADRPDPTFTFTVPEGLTLEQTANTISSGTEIPADNFEKAAKETDYGYAFLDNPDIETTEGFLFPKQYEFKEGTEAPLIVNRMLEQYLIETQNLDFGEAREATGLNEYELLTVASLIEREAANSEERPKVASVIYNRLNVDMPLQIDATIQYARGEPKERLSLEDLEIESPYNTYTNKGLPPGPICSPSLDSIKAALEPADTDFVYYVLKKNGNEHFFTESYDRFLEAKAAAGR